MNMYKLPARLLVLLTLLVLLFPASAQFVSGQAGATAALVPIQGLVQYRAANAPENAWQTLTAVQLVAEGDWVRTDNLGEAQLTFFDGNLTTILPNTQIQVATFQMAATNSPVVTLNQSVGDVRNQINRALDSQSSYEVNTPSAVITVRGTDFWSSGTWLSETTVNVASGITEIQGVSPQGVLQPSVFIGQNQSLYVRNDGQPGQPGTFTQPPEPPPAPLAPATCGNGTCEPGEEQICAVDCQTFPNCGNGVCDLEALEGPVTCPADCVPEMRIVQGSQTTTGPTGPQPPSQPCTISTTRGDVEIRVGPGFNRGVRDYLKPNIAIPVIGKSTDSQGNLWWKIQPPGFVAAEADRYWVLSGSKITEAGDCSNVPEAAPSQLIVPPPPAQPTTSPQATSAPGGPPATYTISFYADRYTIYPGECVTIHWDVEGIKEVYYQGKGVVGHSEAMECPGTTTTYELRVVLLDGTNTYRYVTITVVGGY
jgi:hypothetical protein